MTVLLYDHFQLEERASKHLRTWKGWHLFLYTLAAVCGLVNFIVFQHTMQLVDDNCILFPRELEFHIVEIPEQNLVNATIAHIDNSTDTAQNTKSGTLRDKSQKLQDATFGGNTESGTLINKSQKSQDATPGDDNEDEEEIAKLAKRSLEEAADADKNMTAFASNKTHRLMLDTSRTLFENDNDCQFAEFMPILSTIFAAVWMTLFTMCPGGGRPRSGLQQPWSILAPALVFALVMVGLTGHSFTTTNRGMHAFCEAFFDVTNATTCSAVNPYLERGWNASWGIGGRVSATRAASAGVLAAWACAAALLLARCLAAPDFQVKRTGVYVTHDPHQKIIRHLKSPKSQRSSQNSPTKRDTVSVKSEPTATTELVSASVEPGADSAPSSLMATPVRNRNSDNLESSLMMTPVPQRNAEDIEMAYSPQERLGGH